MKGQAKHIFSFFAVTIVVYVCGTLAKAETVTPSLMERNYYVSRDRLAPPVDEEKSVSDRRGDPYLSSPPSRSPLKELPPPSNIKREFDLDKDYNYSVHEKTGDRTHYRAPTEMSFEEFMEMKRREMIKDQWRKASKTEKDQDRQNEDPIEWGLLPVNGEPLVSIRPAGSVTISLGGKWQRTENPAFPVNQQSTGGIDFDQQISLSLEGTVGDRVKVSMNWDTQAAFDFDNNFKVEYQGKDYDIIKDIQVGNVSMPVDNTLIRGAQNLFGVKAALQFGKLDVTALVSQQRGVQESITIKGGGQARPIDKQASDYEYNRHFFLSHYFKKKFDEAFDRNPTAPNTGFRITRVEVYKTNLSNQSNELRTITALADLGENGFREEPDLGSEDIDGYLSNKNDIIAKSIFVPSNEANNLYETLTSSPDNRKTDEAVSYLQQTVGLNSGTEFEKISSARRLEENVDYSFHPDLGFLSMTTSLKDDEALAVAFEYTLNGVTYKVGELPEDYQELDQVQDVIFMKLLKPQSINTENSTWSLMMKNIYALNTSNVQRDNFQLRVIYKDDLSGSDNPSLPEGQGIAGVPLLRLLQLDKLDPNGDFKPDGNFDFLDNATINAKRGKVIFPVQEPFGSYLDYLFATEDPNNALSLSGKYTFSNLYNKTQNIARQTTSKDKFFINGSYQSASSTDIALPGLNIAEGSVSITVGSQSLQEGSDFSVDYQFGRVKILNTGVLASGQDIIIRYEKSDLFSVRQKNLLGTRLQYNFSDQFKVGFTLMYLSEQPFVTRVNIGSEPIRNTQFGLDVKFRDKSRLITKIVDKIPGYNSKTESSVDLNWEFAGLKPGHSSVLGETGTSYIDDFEGAATPYDFTRSPQTWRISSINQDHPDWAKDSTLVGFHRAKLNWYSIDNSFYQSANSNPGFGLSDECTFNNFSRAIIPQEIFVNRQPDNGGIILNQSILDLAYYPKERGPYNYNAMTNEFDFVSDNNGGNVDLFRRPEENWGSIVRPITFDTDFDKANIEYIEFWVMSPFTPDNTSIGNAGTVHPDLLEQMQNTVPYPVYQSGSIDGKLNFHLGDVSEDVLRDGVHSFENGIPDENATETVWGNVTSRQFITDAFDNTQERSLQDVGLEGLNNVEEQAKHSAYYNWAVANNLTKSVNDPSNDDYAYFINSDGDERCIVERYRNYNGQQGNSILSDGTSTYPQASYTQPDNEDINEDRTLSFTDNYFEYSLDIDANTFSQNGVDNNPYVVDRVLAYADDADRKPVEWYQVRIPIRGTGKKVGNISGFETIKFFRMNFEGFQEPVMLRMAELQLVSAQWRRFGESLEDQDLDFNSEPYDNFSVGVVNVEDNSQTNGSSSPYVLPPGVIRDQDQTTSQVREQNEQSMLLKVSELKDGDGRGVFKNMAIDMINYEKLQMFVHAEAPNTTTQDGETAIFVRMGTDNSEHYYEVEIPLVLSDVTSSDPNEVWRQENWLDLNFSDLSALKVARNNQGFDPNKTFATTINNQTLKVKGNPDRSTVRTMMIGIRNPKDDGVSKAVTVWVNELRVTGFNEEMGFATTGNFNIQAADLLNWSGSMKYIGSNYGDIDNKISERSRSQQLQYGTAVNISLDKLLPEKWGFKIPLYTSYDKELIIPDYNPLDPDVKTEDALEGIDNDTEREDLENKIQYQKEVKSINVTNFRKVTTDPKKKKKIYSTDNITLSAGYTEETRSGISDANGGIGNNLHSYQKQNYKGSIGYAYTFTQKGFTPFQKSKMFKSKHLKLIKDFNVNFLPNDIGVKFDLDRTYIKTQLYNSQLTTVGVDPTYEKSYFFNRQYNLSWNFTKNLRFTYKARAAAIVDEPDGDKNGDINITREAYRDSVRENFWNGGRVKNFDQEVKLTYKIPLNKIPWLNWINSDVSYTGGYKWMAGALGNNDPSNANGGEGYFYGNNASNSQGLAANGKVNMVKLYNKSKFLKSINNPPRRKKLKFKVTDSTGTSSVVEGRSLDIVKRQNPDAQNIKQMSQLELGKKTLRLLMLVRNLSGSYKQTNSIILPGYMGSSQYVGLDTRQDGFSDFLPFVLGSQSLEGENGIKALSAKNNWLTQSTFTNATITQSKRTDINLKGTLEPIKSFKISLNMKYSTTTTYSEVYRRADEFADDDDFTTFNPVYGGSVSMTTITAQTMFVEDRDNNSNANFEDFVDNRSIVQSRLNAQDQSNNSTYGGQHQDVMIPAFLAAYQDKNASSTDLSRLPSIPLPNWRVDYNGLGKMKFLKKKFSSITLKHAYSSRYDISNYTSSLTYTDISSKDNVSDITDRPKVNDNGEYVPEFAITEVTIRESFKPLVGVNIRTKKKISFRFDYNKSRDLALSMANAQVTEIASDDYVFGLGWTIPKLQWKAKDGSKTGFKNEITIKMDVSIKDTKTTQRSLDGTNTVTAGNWNFQLRPNINYKFSKRATGQFYFERTINDPYISTSFRRSTTAVGFRIRFNLQ